MAQYRRNTSLEDIEANRLLIAITRNHVPVPYDGSVLLLCHEERSIERGEVWDLGWKGVVSDLTIQTIGGNYMSIFEEGHLDAVASLLRQRSEEAPRISASSVAEPSSRYA
jgi:thioesterase domain-containing protein